MPSTKLHAAKKCRIGRPSIKSMFPGIVNTARAFVEENGFEAHRRRDTVGKCGTTLANIREHLLDVTPGLAFFTKCQLPDQCDHCSRFPIKNPEAVAMYKQFPTPTPSTSFPGHFHSFIEALQLDRGSPDEHMPQCQEKQLGTCPDCKFLQSSEKNKQDHRRLFHPRQKATGNQQAYLVSRASVWPCSLEMFKFL